MTKKSFERSGNINKVNNENIPQIRFNFDGSWEIKNIKNFADIVGGGTPSTSIDEYWDGDINWFTPTEVGQTKYVSESQRRITKEGLNNSSAKILPKNTILLTTRATIGRVSITNNESTTNQGFQSVICKNVDLNFMYYLLQTLEKTLMRRSVGSTFLEISKKEIENIKVNVPSIDEQKKIGEFLSLVDQKIELMEKKYRLSIKFKQYLIKNMLPKKSSLVPILRFKNFNKHWNSYKVDDLFNLKRGEVISKSLLKEKRNLYYKYPVYSSQTINNGILGYSLKYMFEGKYITWTTDGVNAGKVNYRKGKFCCTNVCGLLDPIENKSLANRCNAEYLNLQTKRYVSTAGNPKLMNNVMAKIPIKIPSIEEQIKISDLFENLDNKIDVLKKEIVVYKEFKRSLLNKMFC